MKAASIAVGILALLMSSLVFAQTDKPVAVVNGEKIMESQFITTLKARYGDRTLNALISNVAIRQAAKTAGVAVSKDDVERRLLSTQRAIEMRAPATGENFELWLAKRGLNKEYFRSELYDEMLLEKMVQGQVKVTDADVSSFYQRNKDEIADPASVRIAHICVKTPQEAQSIRADLLAGKITWDDAVKKYTLDPWTKDNGGDMGMLTYADDPFHKMAFSLKANGDLSGPVQSPLGFHILKRLEFKEARVPKFEEVEATIRDQMERRQLKQLSAAKRDEILKAAKLESLEKLPEETPPPAQ